MKRYISHKHRNGKTIVRIDLIGKHRQYALCSDCLHERSADCPIYRDIESAADRHNAIAIVWECPRFMVKRILRIKLLQKKGTNIAGDVLDIVEIDGSGNLYYLDWLGNLTFVKQIDKGKVWKRLDD